MSAHTYIVANWKSNINGIEFINFINSLHEQMNAAPVLDEETELIVCPPAIYYFHLYRHLDELSFSPGLQDISIYEGGAHTGEISARTLAKTVPEYIIIGHSERRREFSETNEVVIKKAEQAWSIGSTPIICFDMDEIDELAKLLEAHTDKMFILAYEPVSAISTSGTAGNLDPEQLKANLEKVRAHENLKNVPILYGGSVTEENAAAYTGYCDGLLIGSASLNPTRYFSIAENFQKGIK